MDLVSCFIHEIQRTAEPNNHQDYSANQSGIQNYRLPFYLRTLRRFLPTENGVLYVVPFVQLFNNSSGFTLQSIFQSIKRSNQSTSSLFLFYESYGCLEFWKHVVDSKVSFIHVLFSLFYGDSIEFFFIFFSVV